MDRKSFYVSLIILVILFLGTVRLMAQAPEEESQVQAEDISITAEVGNKISYQGVLKEGGSLVNGSRNMNFRLFSNSSCTTLVQAITQNNVPVDQGVFSVKLAVDPNHFNGQGLWLRVLVGGVRVLNCEEILAVPYALGLKPGINVIGNSPSDSTIYASNTATTGASYGVYGRSSSPAGRGVYGQAAAGSGVTYGVYGRSSSPAGRGVFGEATNTISGSVTYGVYGISLSPTGIGVYGEASGTSIITGPISAGGYFKNNRGVALYAETNNFGNIIEAWNPGDREFYVSSGGFVYADGSFIDTGADFAEMMPAMGGLEPGDVLAIGLDGNLTRSHQPYQTSVVGVYSTQPGFLGGVMEDVDQSDHIPLALVGRVPVKVSAENGPIQPGDLLVASATPGHAMKADADPLAGSVIGKALAGWEEGAGIIQMLVMLQ